MGERANIIKSEAAVDNYALYMKDMNGPPLGAEDLEFVFDCADKKTVTEYRNFDPVRLMTLLIERASKTDTPPAQFQEEINNLIASKREVVRYLSGKQSMSDLERYPPQWYLTLKKLENKYNIKSEGVEPDTVTQARLGFMFPHYYVQAVLKMPLWSSLPCASASQKISEAFDHPEFAVVIPDAGNLKDDVRRGIITVYVFRQREKTSLSYRTLFLLLKRRIETSQLSNDRRIRFLQTISIIKLNGVLSPKAEEALKYVKAQDEIRDEKIEDELLWNYLK